jgi:Flp pilus assembly protein TadD
MSSDLVITALSALRKKEYAVARNAMATYAQSNTLEFQHYMIKGLAELALENWNDAYRTFSLATDMFPHQPQLWFNRGLAEENLGHLDDAIKSFQQSLDLKRDQGDVYGNLSNIYRKQARFSEAEAMAHQAFELGGEKSQALNSLGLALGKQGKFVAAEQALQEATKLDKNNPDILANLANLEVDQLKFSAAWPYFAAARALQDKPIIRRDEGMARLLSGDYTTGQPLYESRLDLPGGLRIRPPCLRYKGELLAGKKLIVLAEQGLGDTIMFCRYEKLLIESGAEVIWVVQKSLQRLLQGNLSGRIYIEGHPLPEADYYVPLLSLLKKPASSGPYLRPPAGPRLVNAYPNLRRIGLVWSGSPTHERNHERSIPLEKFNHLFAWVPAQFYAPFTGTGISDITSKMPITSLANQISDFADTASILSQLDCLVTVDTATAHLAGAMGIKTYLLLQYCPDWRWGTEGETTPWYPSMTLIRQLSYGDWEDVVVRLIQKLL